MILEHYRATSYQSVESNVRSRSTLSGGICSLLESCAILKVRKVSRPGDRVAHNGNVSFNCNFTHCNRLAMHINVVSFVHTCMC
jgi:hypothetical protein